MGATAGECWGCGKVRTVTALGTDETGETIQFCHWCLTFTPKCADCGRFTSEAAGASVETLERGGKEFLCPKCLEANG